MVGGVQSCELNLTVPASIVNYLDNKCAKIEHAISLKQSKIEILKEYKKSLIYECVTGKRDCTAGGQIHGA